jgi:hypothetical protein
MFTETFQGARTPIAGSAEKVTGLSSAKGLTVPNIAKRALVTVTGEAIRWTDDGTTPTATVGHRVAVGGQIELNGIDQMKGFRAIQEGASAILDVTYYKASKRYT